MDYIKNALGGNNADPAHQPAATNAAPETKEGGFNFGNVLNGAMGGGPASEKNEGKLSIQSA
jgi:hypothetical protein